MDLTTMNYYSMTIHEGLDDIPRIIIRLKDSKQYGYPGQIQEVEINGVKGFIDKVIGQDLYINMIDPSIFQKFESKSLGNNLRGAIDALNIKPNLSGTFESITQDFHMIKETPWHAFIRLSRYLPKEYYMVCLCDKIKIFKNPNPGDFVEPKISSYTTEADYSIEYTNLISTLSKDNDNGNPSYGGLVTIPISKMLLDDILTSNGTDVINNYITHYKNKDSYFTENLLFQSINPNFNIGDGITINGSNFMIISRSITVGSSVTTNGAYRCIKVS